MDLQRNIETQARIRELRESIDLLEAQLNEASNQEVEQHRQHELIDQLDTYIDAVDTKVTGLKSFWQVLKKELGGR